MQSAACANVTVVTTAESLVDAVTRGDPHIEIQAHIDLTKRPHEYLPISNWDGHLGSLQNGAVKSIRV